MSAETGMGFGRIKTTESYFNGRIKSTKVEYEVPELVDNKADALSELMRAIDLITTKQTHCLTIRIEADPVTHKLKLITKNYVVEKK